MASGGTQRIAFSSPCKQKSSLNDSENDGDSDDDYYYYYYCYHFYYY